MADDINTTLEELRVAIKEFTEKSGQCCQPKGSKTGSEPSTQAPEYGGIDDPYPDAEAFFDARCNACNAIYDTILGAVDWLDANNVEWKAGLFGGLTTGLIFGLIAAGPGGWALAAAGTIITGLTVWLIRESFDFSDLSTALDDVHEELVEGLYNTSDVATAKSNFLSILGGATPTPSSAELTLVGIMLGEDLLNNIYEPRSDMATYQSPDPIDCGAATLQVWPFVASGEGWTFRDDSSGTYSASGVHVPAREAWEITIVGLGTEPGPKAKGTIYIDSLAIAVGVGNSVQLDFGAIGDGVSTSKHIKVIFSDASEIETSMGGAGQGTLVLPITESKTIEEIECWIQRNWSIAFDTTGDFLEVRVQ